MVPKKGTFDIWFTAPAAGGVQTLASMTSPSTIFVLDVTPGNSLRGQFYDSSATAVAIFTDATIGALVEGQRYNVKFSWDAEAGTVSSKLNGVAIDSGDFSTPPAGPWDPATPTEVTLGGPNTWNAPIHLFQISSQVL